MRRCNLLLSALALLILGCSSGSVVFQADPHHSADGDTETLFEDDATEAESDSPADNDPTESTTRHADLEVLPQQLNFGYVSAATQSTRTFQISNIGEATGFITSIVVSAELGSDFKLSNVGTAAPEEANYPLTLQAGESLPVVVTLTAPAAATSGLHFSGFVTVKWRDAADNKQILTVDLRGSMAGNEPPCIDINPLNASGTTLGTPGIFFGLTPLEAKVTRNLTIKNCGDKVLVIDTPTWDHGPFGLSFSAPLSARTVPPHSEFIIPVTFQPFEANEVVTAAIRIRSNAEKAAWLGTPLAAGSEIKVQLQGISGKDELAMLPDQIDFGTVNVGCCSAPEKIRISNSGEQARTVNSMIIADGSSGPSAFGTMEWPDSWPVSVLSASQGFDLTGTLRFCPKMEGPAYASVLTYLHNPDSPYFVVPLTGIGTPRPQRTETWVEPPAPKVDILWVVDNSGSLAEEQNRMAAGFASFITQATNRDADLQIAVISTDIDDAKQSGRFLGRPGVIRYGGDFSDTLSQQEAIDAFVKNVKIGTAGSSNESGLEAARLALSEPLISGANSIFLRHEAKLAVVFLSDENDQSKFSTAFYADFLRQIKGLRETAKLEVYAVIGDPKAGLGCVDNSDPNTPQAAEAGQRYEDVAALCNPHQGEEWMSICSADYAPFYATMAKNLLARRTRYILSQRPEVASIVVRVNNASVGGWSYDEQSNAVVFAETSIPPGSSTVTVSYNSDCSTPRGN